MIYYAHRTLAILYLLGWLFWTTTKIGEPSSGKALEWQGAWAFVSAIGVGMWLGWQARRESHESEERTL